MSATVAFKIVPLAHWQATTAGGSPFPGYGIDEKDGYIHLSTKAQSKNTAARYFTGSAFRPSPRPRPEVANFCCVILHSNLTIIPSNINIID